MSDAIAAAAAAATSSQQQQQQKTAAPTSNAVIHSAASKPSCIGARSWCHLPESCTYCGGGDSEAEGRRLLVLCSCCFAAGAHVGCYEDVNGAALPREVTHGDADYFCTPVGGMGGGKRVGWWVRGGGAKGWGGGARVEGRGGGVRGGGA